MILVGNQRGGGRDLAAHLFSPDNDHVTVHEVRGFASDDVHGAFQEAYAMSKGTRCKQFLFSLSFNPPPRENVSTETFEDAIARAEAKLGLTNQPRVIVFHEKEGRRHAHAVWSRIDIEEMKAVQLSYSHRKLQDLSRELYLEHGWRMPEGLADQSRSDPRNFTLDEWQQAKRQGHDPRTIKTALQDAWAISDNKAALVHALKERGYSLARGDRRGYVAVDHNGEVYALSKWAGVKTKDVRARLGEANTLPSLDEAKATFAKEMQPALSRWERELQERIDAHHARTEANKHGLIERQAAERKALFDGIEDRRIKETQARQERFRTGLAGFWDKLRGEHRRLREENEKDAYECLLRDRRQKDDLIFAQLEQRRALQERHKQDVERLQDQQRGLAEDRTRFDRAAQGPPDPVDDRKRAFLENRRNTGDSPERPRAPEPEH
ncbi:relaxase/mobilization nuclease domain-containing protein [Gloeobacter morelensis]|uniref:Relaxase/mobilization nuclease domain-containing protein n=1 Tax=Gloeobacter morelensis MG652769 TaxID=2781736 RepID=A0ABY3PLS8_9CYAN|nr:relaxase/mobilization nuclease domain-containing protein [Gloeobacter morelensis]UFP94611.1 relaxase/mobilization nuclease domain-containing protein [Gloeobacter morelensis MG652769]